MKPITFIILILYFLTVNGQNRFPIEIDNKFGYIDKKGDVKIDPIYDFKGEFINGFAVITQKDLRTIVIDSNGQKLIEFKDYFPHWVTEREWASQAYPFYFENNRMPIFDTTLKKYGFIDEKGRWVIEPEFTNVTNFSEGRAAVGFWDNDPNKTYMTGSAQYIEYLNSIKWGFIDTNGVLKIDTLYCEVSSFEMGICRVDDKFIDMNGNKIDLDTVSNQEILCRIQNENPDFHYQKNGKYVLYSTSDNYTFEAREFYDGFTARGNYGFVDCQNNWVILPKYQNVRSFSDGFAGVQRKIDYGKFDWGFINYKGDTVINFQYQEVGSFYHGVVPVCKNEKWGVVDINNNVIIPLEYDNRIDNYKFTEGLILLYKNDKQYYFNVDGKQIWKEN